MRVVAGSARGRRLVAPPGTGTRPTSDRAREGIFNMVASRLSLDGARVADLFAGSGAMGIEALSRGAASVTFIERDRRAVQAIRDNLASLENLGFAAAANVVSEDVMAWARARDGANSTPFDVVFADPPYAFDEWAALAAALTDCRLLVAESDRPADLGAGWGLLTERRYGGTVVVLASPSRKVSS